jgi:hypothetical protein
MAKDRKPGSVPPGRVGVYDARGNYRGHVGEVGGSAATAARLGVPDAVLTVHKGKRAWCAKGLKNEQA